MSAPAPVEPNTVTRTPRRVQSDSFEQNPLIAAAGSKPDEDMAGLPDEQRVREALRLVLTGDSLKEAGRRCHVAPSVIAEWRQRYLDLIDAGRSAAGGRPFEEAGMVKDADLIHIPQQARELFAENWERLLEHTRANPRRFYQSPLRVFLETSLLTSWLFTEGKLDRSILSGVVVVSAGLLLTGSFLTAGRFYRSEPGEPDEAWHDDQTIDAAAGVVQSFFKASGVAEKMKFVRLNDDTRRLMEDYYRKHPADPITDAQLSQSMTRMGITNLEFEIPSRKRKHMFNVLERGGQRLLDWETCTLFQEEHIASLRERRTVEPVRVAARLEPGDYYNYGFTEKDYSCYEMSYPGLKLDLFAYAVRESLEDQTLKALLKPMPEEPDEGDGSVSEVSKVLFAPVVMLVKYPAEAKAPNQVQIVRVLHDKWVAN